ncbi:MAG TPA: hypothetical protein VFW90_00345 [Candidatus Saccharimonadales bacterium]|nr:hypothetical protein [Candidatus Saccharimonadales bacterium]
MAEENNSPWRYKPDDSSVSEETNPADNADESAPKKSRSRSVSWEASEYIDHPHGANWYAGLVVATIVLAIVIYLISRDIFAAVTIVIVGIIVGVFVRQKPRLIKYEINDSGITIDGKIYGYSSFKSFAIIREGALSSVNLFPLKRFMPPITAYYEPEDEKKIADALGNHLPYEERKMDTVDRLSRRLRL